MASMMQSTCPGSTRCAHGDERVRVGARRGIERADDRRLDDVKRRKPCAGARRPHMPPRGRRGVTRGASTGRGRVAPSGQPTWLRAGGFLQTNVNAFAFVFEFLEAMLLHELEQTFDFGEVYASASHARGRFRFRIFWPFTVREIPVEQLSNRSEPRLLLPPRRLQFECRPSPSSKRRVRLSGPCLPAVSFLALAKARHLVNFETQSVSGAVGEITSKTMPV